MKILIADNHFLSRKGIISVISEEFKGSETAEVSSPAEMLKFVQEENTDLLIIDPDSFTLTDFVELSVLKKRNPDTSVLVITNNRHQLFIRKMIEKGITNFIFKDCNKGTLVSAIRSALEKEKYLDPQVIEALSQKKSEEYEIQDLTRAEKEIVRLIGQGLTTKEIATRKYLSYHTIITHRKNIFRKLKINNISELLMYAVNAGIIDTTEYYI